MDTARTLHVLIADDELLARERLRKLLGKSTNVEVVAMADNGAATVEAIRTHAPDLVFLDIQMPGMNGFDVIRQIGPEAMPATVFVTAYDRYALKAFDLAAVDYLLKPFENERFELALQRAQRLIDLQQSGEAALRLRRALESLALDPPQDGVPKPTSDYIERIAVKSRGEVRVVLASQIDYIAADGVYAELHVGDKAYVVRERMQALEERLDPRYFFRIHRSVIVQLDRIDVLICQSGGDYTLKLKSGVELAVSRGRIEQLERWMGGLPSGGR